jgi:prepilin peptidase CpaA
MLANFTPEQTLLLSAAIAFAIAVVATVTDVRTGKVYNWLTAPATIAGVLLSVALLGVEGLKLSLIGIALGMAVWFVQPLLGKPFGGGDVKLMIAVGALTGYVFLGKVILLSCIWAGLLAIGLALRRRKLLACIKETKNLLCARFIARTPMALQTAAQGAKVPFAGATALAVLTAVLLSGAVHV